MGAFWVNSRTLDNLPTVIPTLVMDAAIRLGLNSVNLAFIRKTMHESKDDDFVLKINVNMFCCAVEKATRNKTDINQNIESYFYRMHHNSSGRSSTSGINLNRRVYMHRDI